MIARQKRQKPTIPALVASRDVKRVQDAIADKYGFTPPVEYCQVLIAFVDDISAHITELEARKGEQTNVGT